MGSMQIGILEPDNFSKEAIESLEKVGKVSLFNGKDLSGFLLKQEIIFIRFKYHISHDFLEKAPDLKYICTPTTGLNHLEVKEIKKRKISIISLKGEEEFLTKIRATPEHILGLTLSLLRNYREAFLNINKMSLYSGPNHLRTL